MEVTFSVKFDHDAEGYRKLTKGGHQRFALIVQVTGEKSPSIIIRGWRVDEEATRIMPPTSFSKGSTFTIATLGMDFEYRLLNQVRLQMLGTGVVEGDTDADYQTL